MNDKIMGKSQLAVTCSILPQMRLGRMNRDRLGMMQQITTPRLAGDQ